MKKIFASILALTMVGAMSVSAFATELTTTPSNNNGAGDYTIGVNGTYVAGANAEEKISVDIAWESMDFTYTAGDSSYDVTTHKTTTKDGSWSTNKPGITVTNHSNVAIDANMSFAATASGVVGTFYTKSGDDFTAITTEADQKLALDSAEGETAAPEGVLYFGISGDAISKNKSLGTITVKIAKDAATTVTDEAGLKAALEAIKTTGGTVKLGNDINVGSDKYFEINGGTETAPIILDLNGHTLTGMLASGYDTTSNASVSSNVVIQNGTIKCVSDTQFTENPIVMSKSNLKLKDVTVNATNYIAAGATSGGKIEVVDSALNGGLTFSGITSTCLNAGGEFIFSGTVTIEGVIGMADHASNNAKVTLKADGTYTFNGADVAVTVDTDYTVSDCDSAEWLQGLG